MKKIILLPLLFLSVIVFAQTRTLTGKVLTQKDGTAIAKATINIKGNKTFAVLDDGSFSVQVPAGKIVLRVSAVGFAAKEVTLNSNDNNITISLEEENKSLNEVIVVGYSDKKRSELTSSVSVVKADKLKDVTSNDVGSMLQGKVAGLQVVNSSGVPGAAAEIRLRGVSSVNASQSPLYVVDGIIGGNFDPNDVESITVLKDAAATAMYGSQANAGVIV
ncbi:MAG: TonB-dependent receptor plug domain-containing protein, partial [Panacibacter sp.]